VAVETCAKLDAAVLTYTDVQRLAEGQIREREGVGGVAGLDQKLAEARDRLPKLRALLDVLIDHLTALEKMEE
jgi:hypothetical protein